MDLTAISDTRPSKRPSEAAPKQASIGGDFNTFLKMLTVQMQNQDPLNPMESSEFAVQLATFSSVEQQVRTNDFLAEMVSTHKAGLSTYTDLIGANVRVKGNFRHSGAPVLFELLGNNLADGATVLISDEDGKLISSAVISPDDSRFEWSGTSGGGMPAPVGEYSVSVRYTADGEEIENASAKVMGRVVEARFDGTEVQLVLANGAVVSPDDVTSISASDE